MSVHTYLSDLGELLHTQCSVNVRATIYSTDDQFMDFALTNNAVVYVLLLTMSTCEQFSKIGTQKWDCYLEDYTYLSLYQMLQIAIQKGYANLYNQ